MKKRRAVYYIFIGIWIAAFVSGSIMVYIAWQHNPQGIYHMHNGDGSLRAIAYADLAIIFFSWFLVTGLPLSIVELFVVLLVRQIKKKSP